MRKLLNEALRIIGAISLMYLLLVGLHELVHVKNANDYGIKVKEVCILGYNLEHGAFAWTEIYSLYKPPEDRRWDYIWYEWIEKWSWVKNLDKGGGQR